MRTRKHLDQDAQRPPGFTLVELLVVIMIIMVLVAMMMPTFNRVRLSMRTSASVGTMRTIEAGCELFKQDFGAYPPSGFIQPGGSAGTLGMPMDIANSTLSGITGGAWLVQCLVGTTIDDGQPGYGFKSGPRTVNGPYGVAKDLPVAAGFFVDSFERPFLYYRFDKRDTNAPFQYYAEDNPPALPTGVNAYASYTPPSGPDQYYRKDYLLITSGADGEYRAPQNDGPQIKSDDITNMLGH